MSNTVSFGIKLEGAPQAKAQLQEIASLQAKLSKGNVLSGINPATVSRSPELLAELKRLTATQAGPFPYGAFLNQSMGIGAGQNRPARSNYQNFWRSMVPPQLVPPVIPQGINWRQAGLGAAVSPFSPWIGARMLSGSGLFGSGGGGGLFGAGGIGGFAGAFLAVKLASEGLRIAFEQLKNAVNEGAQLYQHAARLGLEVGKTAQLEALSRTIGLSKTELDTLALQGSHIRSGGRRQGFFQQSDLKLLLGAGGTGQLGNLQQVKNMADYVTRTFRDTAVAVRAIAEDSRAMQEIKYGLGVVATQLQAVFTDLITLAFPIIKQMLNDIIALLLFSGNILHAAVQGAQKLGLVPSGGPGTSRIQAGRSGSASAVSPWERMGFVIGGFGQADYARKTAENTAEIAKSTKGMNEKLAGLMPLGANGAGGTAAATHTFFHRITPLP